MTETAEPSSDKIRLRRYNWLAKYDRETINAVIDAGMVFFLHMILFDKENGTYYRGIYATYLDGYVVSLEVQSGSEERLRQLLSSAVKINGQKH